MSIAAMVDNEVDKSERRPPTTALGRRARQRRGRGGERELAATKKPTTSPSDAITSLVSYVPAEAIAAYVLLLPFMDPSGDGYSGRWGLAGGVAVLAVVYAVGYRKIAAVQAETEFKFPWVPVLFSAASFAAWVFAIPESPFNDFAFYSPELGAAAGTVAATLISFVGAVTGESLTYAAAEEAEPAGLGGEVEATSPTEPQAATG
jgi:hypothetical protein